MSCQKQMISIEPPRYGDRTEVFYVSNYRCPVCNGIGAFMSDLHAGKPDICDHCDGTGKVKAKVTIEWTPDRD